MRRIGVTILGLMFASQTYALSVDEPSSSATSQQLNTAKHASVIDISAWEKSRQRQQRVKNTSPTKVIAKTPKLRVASGAALVIDQTSGALLYGKNIEARQPIASITKLMTAMVVLDANQPLDEKITIAEADVDHLKYSHSRLKVGTELTRFELIQLAIMSSENRAAAALGRNYPDGSVAFIAAMNAKAKELGMNDSTFADPSGLDEHNVSTASDLAKMVDAAYGYDLIRRVSTTTSYVVESNRSRATQFKNTNALVRKGEWEIGLSKTGFIREAGHCLVMQAQISTRNLIIILLDSRGKMTRIGDANRIKKWLERTKFTSQKVS